MKNYTFYHGTTKKQWQNPENDGTLLYLTVSLSEAESYASEMGESEWDDDIHTEGGLVPELMVLSFSLKELEALPITLEPDWGWVTGLEYELKYQGKVMETIPSWQESLEKVGSIAVSGFEESHKLLAKPVTKAFAS